jgi:endonuclease-3
MAGRFKAVPASARRQDVAGIIKGLKREYPDAECALQYQTPEQLLVATILSAQCTDERVNLVTADLFRRYPTPADLAALPISTLERLIQSTGFFRNKAKNIKACCAQLVERYRGKVPRDLDDLVNLPGVGRKTANVVLGTAYGLPTGVVVDTHVARVSRRLGLTESTDPVKIERDLMALLPQREWIMFAHRLIHHGRKVCRARKPNCAGCCLATWCPRVGVSVG